MPAKQPKKPNPLIDQLLQKSMGLPIPNVADVPLESTNVFHIAFETNNAGGYIRSIKVTIEEDAMDNLDVVRVDLANHPLYGYLQDYVKNNPRG